MTRDQIAEARDAWIARQLAATPRATPEQATVAARILAAPAATARKASLRRAPARMAA